jgi:hypothetical protein
MNIWAGIIIGAIGLGVWGLSKLSHAAGELVTQVKARIFKLDISSITIAIDVIIKNPTNTEINIQYPFLKIIHDGAVLASSDLKSEQIAIKPFSQTTINNIQIPISFLYMASLAPEIIKKVKDKTYKINLQVSVDTRVIFANSNIPYSHTQDVSI